jgi:hypothetical protein
MITFHLTPRINNNKERRDKEGIKKKKKKKKKEELMEFMEFIVDTIPCRLGLAVSTIQLTSNSLKKFLITKALGSVEITSNSKSTLSFD